MKKLLIVAILLLVVLVLAGGLVVYLRPIRVISALRRHDLVKSGFVKNTVDSPIGAQTIFAAGSGPGLIFLHGAGDDSGTWKEIAPKFASKYRVVLVDLAGHGDSAPASGPLKMQTILDGLDAVVAKEIGENPRVSQNQAYPGHPVVLVGNSLGAWVAMLYAKEHPERVARVVAVDGGPLKGDRVDLAKLPENREDARKIWDAIQDPGSPHLPDFILDDVVRESHKGPIGRMDRDDLEQHLATEESLRGFPVQVDLIWGNADRLVPPEYADRLKNSLSLPRVGLTMLARCGHIPQQECPIKFSQELENTLTIPPESRPTAPGKDAAVKEK